MSNQPTNWTTSTLPDLVGKDGLFLDGDWVESKDQDPNGGVRLIQVADVGNGTFRDRSSRYMNRETTARLNCTFLEEGDLLIARLPDPIGRACRLPNLPAPAVTAVDVSILRLGTSEIHPEWLTLMLNTPQFLERCESLAGGTTRKRVSRSNLATIPVPIPPRQEQERIARKLEDLLARARRARAALEAIPQLLDRFRQSVLNAACSGRLTRSWRKSRGLPDDGTQQPRGWTTCSLGDLLSHLTSGSRAWTEYCGRGSSTFVMAQNVRPGRLDLTNRNSIDPPLDSRDAQRTRLLRGDLLVTIVGANTGDVCTVEDDLDNHFVCQSVALLRPRDITLSSYLSLFLNSQSHGRKQFAEFTYGQGRPHLSFEQIRMTQVDLPPAEEMNEIVRLTTAAFSNLGGIQELYATAHNRLSNEMPAAILSKAFRGELVPQDPSDEPASVLLERIRAERAASGADGKKPRRSPKRAKA